jgi:hypothetical protein
LPTDIEPIPENEAQWDRALMARGIEFVLQEPGRYILLSLSRTADYLLFWPLGESSTINNIGRVLSFGLFLPFMLYGLWISLQDNRRFHLLYLFIAFYSLMHLLTWSMVRYRLPVDAVLVVFAALGLVSLAGRLPILKKWNYPARN